MHMQNQLSAGSFVGTKFGIAHDMPFFLLCSRSKMGGFDEDHSKLPTLYWLP